NTISDAGFWIGVGVAALALLIVALLLILVLRSRRAEARRFETAIRESNDRVESLLSGISGSLELARVESDRSRRIGELGSTIDLDEVLQRTLETAGAVPLVDAAMIVLPNDGKAIVATMGLSNDEARTFAPNEPPDGRLLRAVDFQYRYPDDDTANGDAIAGGRAIALLDADGESIGTLSVFWRGTHRTLDDDQNGDLEELAAAAAPAIDNARRFQEARQLADLDALTGLHNHRFFHETLARETARAHRYDRDVALIVFDIDDFKAINDRIGHLAGDAVLAEAAARVQGVVRSADIASRVGGDEFAVILPESTLADAEQLYRRLQTAIDGWRGGGVEIRLSAGIAALRRGDDEISLFKRADEALYEAKRGGKGRAIASGSDARGDQLPEP
ncbi:MAG: diguanylate cyclase, partial [Gaiellales bacterium]